MERLTRGEPRRVFGGLLVPDVPALTDDEIGAMRARVAQAMQAGPAASSCSRELGRVLDALDLALAELRDVRRERAGCGHCGDCGSCAR